MEGSMTVSTSQQLRSLIKHQAPLQVVGTVNAYCAKLAEQAGCQAIYLSGAGVANASFGLPDLAIVSMKEVVEEATRICDASSLPLIVDIDTGFGNQFAIARTIRALERAGVAGVHIEDQIVEKRCGHRPNKHIVSQAEMADRLKAALDARISSSFVIIARTDAYASEGLAGSLERAQYYQATGADVIFPEALPTLDAFSAFRKALSVPILANCTEFGKTPLFTKAEYQACGIEMILYPLSAFRAMSLTAAHVYATIQQQGTQQSLLTQMQTRNELYAVLDYENYEKKMDDAHKENAK